MKTTFFYWSLFIPSILPTSRSPFLFPFSPFLFCSLYPFLILLLIPLLLLPTGNPKPHGQHPGLAPWLPFLEWSHLVNITTKTNSGFTFYIYCFHIKSLNNYSAVKHFYLKAKPWRIFWPTETPSSSPLGFNNCVLILAPLLISPH